MIIIIGLLILRTECTTKKKVGTTCAKNSECTSGKCQSGSCACKANAHCGPNESCNNACGGMKFISLQQVFKVIFFVI